PEDLRLVRGGLLMGIVVDANKPDYVQGDFLVSGLTGADPATGQVALTTPVHPGQVVRLHARDAESADRDLREALAVRMAGPARRRCPRPADAAPRPPRPPPAGVVPTPAAAPGRRGLPPAVALFPAMRIAGATTLLTGATGGLGHAIARALAARGARLVLTG